MSGVFTLHKEQEAMQTNRYQRVNSQHFLVEGFIVHPKVEESAVKPVIYMMMGIVFATGESYKL